MQKYPITYYRKIFSELKAMLLPKKKWTNSGSLALWILPGEESGQLSRNIVSQMFIS